MTVTLMPPASWHHTLTQLTGSLVLAWAKPLRRGDLQQWAEMLRKVADDMERVANEKT